MRRVFTGLFLVAAALMAWYAAHDASLDTDRLSVDRANLPDMSLEALEFQREEGGVEWTVKVALAEKRGGEIRLASLDVTAVRGSEESISLRSPSGVFREEEGTAVLYDVTGSVHRDGEVGLFEAPEADWIRGDDEVTFAKGAVFRREGLLFEGNMVRASFSGAFSAEKGASVSWSVPESSD